MTLQIKNVKKSFDNYLILDDLSLDVREGEFVTILGPSGSGKSTLFHLIGGLLKPDAGEITLDGKNIIGEHGHISYMPQEHCLLPWKSALENILFTGELHNQADKELAIQWIERAGLKDYTHAYPHELSGGMKQRVSFLRALLAPQSFLCMDEPFSALDELTKLELQKWLLSMLENERRTIFFITHSIDEALFLSDKIYVLSDKPAKVIKELSINAPLPRSKDMLLNEEFIQYKKEIYEALGIKG